VSSGVLDATALLALLNQEPGTEEWGAVIGGSVISAVNLSEVVAKLADAGMPEAEIRDALDPLGLEVADFDAEDAYRAGMLRPQTRGFGLSLGDRACLALARQANLPALTADQAWVELRIGVEIRALR